MNDLIWFVSQAALDKTTNSHHRSDLTMGVKALPEQLETSSFHHASMEVENTKFYADAK